MRIAIRADASVEIGTGHVMRCLALADALRSGGAEVAFVCNELEGNLNELIAGQGFQVCRMPISGRQGVDWQSDAHRTVEHVHGSELRLDWLIVDHYGLDEKWERLARPAADRLMVIDDLADRPHDCELLLDQNYCAGMDGRYHGLVPVACRQLLGPSFALLRAEFSQARSAMTARSGELRRLFVFFGGSDPGNETSKALEGIRLLNRPEIAIDVVVGSSNPLRQTVQSTCAGLPNTKCHIQVDNMAELMARADLAIGGGGVSTWERCCLGLPSLVAILADNQVELTHAVAAYGAIENLDWADRLSAADYRQAIDRMTPRRLLEMSRHASELVDGKGRERVLNVMMDR